MPSVPFIRYCSLLKLGHHLLLSMISVSSEPAYRHCYWNLLIANILLIFLLYFLCQLFHWLSPFSWNTHDIELMMMMWWCVRVCVSKFPLITLSICSFLPPLFYSTAIYCFTIDDPRQFSHSNQFSYCSAYLVDIVTIVLVPLLFLLSISITVVIIAASTSDTATITVHRWLCRMK